MKFKTYLVGGAVRDELLGVEPKDLDFVMMAPSFEEMENELIAQGAKIFVRKSEFLTIRCNHPTLGSVDFVCPRGDGIYTDGRHPDSVKVAATLEEDLARRDFTIGAMAKDIETGDIIDPHNGQQDLKNKILRCVGDTQTRFTEDGLRILRALRFMITKGFAPEGSISMALSDRTFFESRLDKIPIERIHGELLRCFKHDTIATLNELGYYAALRNYLFSRSPMWLEPSLKSK